MNVEVNYVAVVLSAVSNMIIGFMWYGPMLFGKRYMKLMGVPANEMKKRAKNMGPWYALTFVGALLIAYVLSHVVTLSMNFFHYDKLTSALITAFWMWLGFMVPLHINDYIFGGKKLELVAISAGYLLTSILVMGVIIGLL